MIDIAAILLPFLFCGDEITDILYLIFNWDDFATQNHKNAAMAFVLLNVIANFFCCLVVFGLLKGLRDADALKVIALMLFCAWVPVLGIVFFLLYFKFVDMAIKFDVADKFLVDVPFVMKMSSLLHYCELFLEDIPQLIIQASNNSQTGKWDIFEYISLGFTVLVIGYEVIKFMLCKEG